MKPRTSVAIQFALWAFFFGRIVPFGGDFLLPIMWIYDRRVFAGFMVAHLLEMSRLLPGAIAIIPIGKVKDFPSWAVPWLIPLTLLMTVASLTFETWLGAYWLRRRIRKVAPDLERVL